MKDKNQKLILKSVYQNRSKEELIESLRAANEETIKYVNKFLEYEEKWMFVNVLLKNLNSIREKQALCDTVCNGFLALTDSKIGVCTLFNPDSYEVEYEQIAASSPIEDKKKFKLFFEGVNSACADFLAMNTPPEEISIYFQSLLKNEIIILPILYGKRFLGYMSLIKFDEKFYDDNIQFINIFPEHIALILENISLYQESEKRNRDKMEFLAGISHEFKTPLNSIIGFSDILKSRVSCVEDFKYVDNISKSSSHLLSLIEDILDVTKSQYKPLELNYSSFGPKDVVEQIVTALEAMCQEKNIDLSYTLIDVKIHADLKRFKQLIYNLISNAIKFNKIGGKIGIITYIKDENFIFEISDTGDGISKKNYDKIFNFFSQVNRNQLKRQLGSGVGLALCKKILDAHGGTIDFQSQFKKGSCFWFSIPMKRG